MKKIVVASNTVVDHWNNGDGTVSLVFQDDNKREVELVFTSSSVLSRLATSADKARDYIKLAKRPPQIFS